MEIINGKYKWEIVEERIQDMIDNPNKIFQSLPLERDYRQELLIAAVKNDFTTIAKLKGEDLVMSPAILHDLKGKNIAESTLIGTNV